MDGITLNFNYNFFLCVLRYLHLWMSQCGSSLFSNFIISTFNIYFQNKAFLFSILDLVLKVYKLYNPDHVQTLDKTAMTDNTDQSPTTIIITIKTRNDVILYCFHSTWLPWFLKKLYFIFFFIFGGRLFLILNFFFCFIFCFISKWESFVCHSRKFILYLLNSV